MILLLNSSSKYTSTSTSKYSSSTRGASTSAADGPVKLPINGRVIIGFSYCIRGEFFVNIFNPVEKSKRIDLPLNHLTNSGRSLIFKPSSTNIKCELDKSTSLLVLVGFSSNWLVSSACISDRLDVFISGKENFDCDVRIISSAFLIAS